MSVGLRVTFREDGFYSVQAPWAHLKVRSHPPTLNIVPGYVRIYRYEPVEGNSRKPFWINRFFFLNWILGLTQVRLFRQMTKGLGSYRGEYVTGGRISFAPTESFLLFCPWQRVCSS